jgi:hypothetical protein
MTDKSRVKDGEDFILLLSPLVLSFFYSYRINREVGGIYTIIIIVV